jgi:hypothetical protein
MLVVACHYKNPNYPRVRYITILMDVMFPGNPTKLTFAEVTQNDGKFIEDHNHLSRLFMRFVSCDFILYRLCNNNVMIELDYSRGINFGKGPHP